MTWSYLLGTSAISFKRAMMAGRFGTARVRVLVEPKPRGTAGALISALDILEPRFILLNGDSLFDINMRALAAEADADCEALIALRCVPEASRYGTVELNDDRVVRFREKVRDDLGQRSLMPEFTY